MAPLTLRLAPSYCFWKAMGEIGEESWDVWESKLQVGKLSISHLITSTTLLLNWTFESMQISSQHLICKLRALYENLSSLVCPGFAVS